MLQSAVEHYKRQQRFTAAALIAARRKNLPPEELARIVAAIQLLAARDALGSVPEMLDEQNIDGDTMGSVQPSAFAGTASDGRPLDSLFSQAADQSRLDLMVVTQIQDAARQAAAVKITSYLPDIGYVRMLNPPSCSRCAVLAGKYFRFNEGFLRHPRCDCRHIPSREDKSGSLTTNPDYYFHSLSSADQDKIFGKGNAEALRHGADMSQVVNARRGMMTAQEAGLSPGAIAAQERLYGAADKFTHSGTTRRGVYGRAEIARGGGDTVRLGRSQGFIKNMSETRSKRGRLMPESILNASKSREDAQRLLRLYGYIT